MKTTILAWDRLHLQSREEICRGAAVVLSVANQKWHDIEPWLRGLLEDSMAKRSWGRAQLQPA